jgi:starch phosphorylase
VEIPRWQHGRLRNVRSKSEFVKVREEIRRESFRALFGREPKGPVITWMRRVTRYKRPELAVKLAEELHREAEFVLGGRAHPLEGFGIGMMKEFKRLSDEGKAHLIVNPTPAVERTAIWASDIWLFTPFSGWEASGTSFMKAGVNGVPSVASIDGAVPEIIRDGFNGWLFGENRLELVEPTYMDHEYYHLKDKVREALDSINSGEYWEIAWNAFQTFNEFAKMERLFHEYYGIALPREEARSEAMHR